MKDGSEFAGARYLILGKVVGQRANLPDTIESFYSQLQHSAQELGGRAHEECSSAIFGPWDVAVFVTLPTPEALYGLANVINRDGKMTTETYLAPSIKTFAQASKNAWSKTGAQSPVEQRR